MVKINEAKDEADANMEEITELRSKLRKEEVEKRRAEDKVGLLTSDKEEAEAKANKFQDEIDATIRDYETKIDNVTIKYLDKIDDLNSKKVEVEKQLNDLQREHEKALSYLKATETELSANKSAYERRIETLERELDDTVQSFDRKIQSMENELNGVHDENGRLTRDKQMLSIQVRNLEADYNEASSAFDKAKEQLNLERDEHEAKVDEVTTSFSQVSRLHFALDLLIHTTFLTLFLFAAR